MFYVVNNLYIDSEILYYILTNYNKIKMNLISVQRIIQLILVSLSWDKLLLENTKFFPLY